MITRDSTLIDVCFAVCTSLDRAGTRAVLTGGSAATFYAPEAYMSDDADYIVISGRTDAAEAALRALGFRHFGGMYVHPESQYTVEFPSGPLAIGDDLAISPTTVHRDDEVLHLLSPTDSVRDRLCWYFLDGDASALRAAVGVARACSIDVPFVAQWVEAEVGWGPRRFSRFREFLEAAGLESG